MQDDEKDILLKHGKLISLSQGNILDNKQRFVGWFAVAVSCLFFILTIVLLAIPQVEWDVELIALMSICDAGAVAMISLCTYIFIKNKKLKQKLSVWLYDSVEIHAYSKKIDEYRGGMQPKATKIRIDFYCNDVAFRKESTVKVFGGQSGYAGCFNNYADKEVNILYSPEYDEVMIIKD